MNTANSSIINNAPRCQHHTRTGRRCRGLVSQYSSGLCSRHALPLVASGEASIASDLALDSADFTSAAQINDFMGKLFVLLAQNRISSRRAAVLTYILQQTLRTLPEIDRENGSDEHFLSLDGLPQPIPGYRAEDCDRLPEPAEPAETDRLDENGSHDRSPFRS